MPLVRRSHENLAGAGGGDRRNSAAADRHGGDRGRRRRSQPRPGRVPGQHGSPSPRRTASRTRSCPPRRSAGATRNSTSPTPSGAFFEPSAGVLSPERCVAVQLRLARRLGAVVRTGETMLSLERCGDGVAVVTDKGRIEAARVVLTAGAWLPGPRRRRPGGGGEGIPPKPCCGSKRINLRSTSLRLAPSSSGCMARRNRTTLWVPAPARQHRGQGGQRTV